MSRAKSNRVKTERDPVWSPDDPERIAYITENAMAVVTEKDAKITRLRRRIAQLERSNIELRRAAREALR